MNVNVGKRKTRKIAKKEEKVEMKERKWSSGEGDRDEIEGMTRKRKKEMIKEIQMDYWR